MGKILYRNGKLVPAKSGKGTSYSMCMFFFSFCMNKLFFFNNHQKNIMTYRKCDLALICPAKVGNVSTVYFNKVGHPLKKKTLLSEVATGLIVEGVYNTCTLMSSPLST
jgi:hypothetical protein